jgi:hypothetical protein
MARYLQIVSTALGMMPSRPLPSLPMPCNMMPGTTGQLMSQPSLGNDAARAYLPHLESKALSGVAATVRQYRAVYALLGVPAVISQGFAHTPHTHCSTIPVGRC